MGRTRSLGWTRSVAVIFRFVAVAFSVSSVCEVSSCVSLLCADFVFVCLPLSLQVGEAEVDGEAADGAEADGEEEDGEEAEVSSAEATLNGQAEEEMRSSDPT